MVLRLEDAETHDEYWSAAMKEMLHTGYMHNYMRMYWGRKMTLYLTNKYFMDGYDLNSYANVAPASASTSGAGRNGRSSARSATHQRAA